MANSPYDPQYASIVNRIHFYADKYGIRRDIAVAQIWKESRFKNNVCSYAGACGIAQFIPDTARRYGVTDRTNIEQSLDGWGRYMRDLLQRFNYRYDLALAGYNWGEGRKQLAQAKTTGNSILDYVIPEETRDYVKSILTGVTDFLSNPVDSLSNRISQSFWEKIFQPIGFYEFKPEDLRVSQETINGVILFLGFVVIAILVINFL